MSSPNNLQLDAAGPLVDVSEGVNLTTATISPNAVRSRIGVNGHSPQPPTRPSNGGAVASSSSPSPLLNTGYFDNRRQPGSIQRSSAISNQSASVNHSRNGGVAAAGSSSVVERHLVRRNYEEHFHQARKTAVGSRLAGDKSPDGGSTVGDIENFDSLSLQMSPSAPSPSNGSVCRSSSATVQTTTLSLANDLIKMSNEGKSNDEIQAQALQLQAELKRTLESSNSASLVDLCKLIK